MILHFYPGQNLLVVISIDPKTNKDMTQGSYEAWGGPSSIGNDPRMPEEPTWPGNYIIDKAHAYRTPTWQMSRIKWRTPYHSHGCIHLKPHDRERLFAIGVFKPGTRFVVYKYNEKFN